MTSEVQTLLANENGRPSGLAVSHGSASFAVRRFYADLPVGTVGEADRVWRDPAGNVWVRLVLGRNAGGQRLRKCVPLDCLSAPRTGPLNRWRVHATCCPVCGSKPKKIWPLQRGWTYDNPDASCSLAWCPDCTRAFHDVHDEDAFGERNVSDQPRGNPAQQAEVTTARVGL